MKRNRNLPSSEQVKSELSFIENESWKLDTIPTHRTDIEFPCLRASRSTAIIYMNQITGKYGLLAKDISLTKLNGQDCLPTTNHNMEIGTIFDVVDFVNKFSPLLDCAKLQELFDMVKNDMNFV